MLPPDVAVSRATAVIPGLQGHPCVRGPFDLAVRSGEFLALLGPSESGMSVLLKMIAGLVPLASGQIRIAENRVESPQTGIGIVFENPLLLGWRTALENVFLQAEVRGLDRNAITDQARRLTVMLGLGGYEDRKPYELSPGMAARVAICRALAHDPPLLLMDDPFRNLDPLDREQIATDLQRLALAPRITVIFTTTLPAEAVQLSDRVAVLTPCGSVQQYLSIDLPRPRRMDKITTPQIVEHCSTIRTLLRAQGSLH